MSAFQTVIIAILFLIEIVFPPIFVSSMFRGKSNKSLFLKMICSTAFLLICILSKLFIHSTGIYSNLLTVALCLAWTGDLFLGINGSRIYFVIGGFFFLFTHFLLIIAFTSQSRLIAPSLHNYTVFDLTVSVLLIVFFEIYNKKKNLSLGKFHIPVLIYAFLLSTMLSKAYTLAKNAFISGIGLLPFFVFAGAILFFISDFTLTYTILDEKKKNDRAYKLLNSYCYFLGEALIASTVLFIK